MKYHVVSLGDHLPDPHTKAYTESQAERFQGIVEQGVLAEKLGFEGFWIGEHHGNKYIVSNPQMILAAMAGRTSRITLGTAISLLPNNDPVRLAEDFATLDLLSNGRAQIGFGSGITPHVFKLFGQKIEDGHDIYLENLELIQRLWNEPSVTWEGRFRSPLEEFRLEPRTYSGKALPIVRATGNTAATAREAALAGHKLSLLTVATGYDGARPMADLYRNTWREAGRDPSDARVVVAAFIFVRDDGEDARDYWIDYMLNYKTLGQEIRAKQGWSESLIAISKGFGRSDDISGKAGQSWIAGSPDEVVDRLHKAYEMMGGFDELNLLFDVGGISTAEVLTSMNVFAEKVIPRLEFDALVRTAA